MEFNKNEFKYLKALIPLYIFDYETVEIGSDIYDECGIDDFVKQYPQTYEKHNGEEYLKIVINLENGHVVNWPLNNAIDLFDYKLSDRGVYALMKVEDETKNDLHYRGYVPHCIGEEDMESAGDYLEFEIDDDSNIANWQGFAETDYSEFVDNAEK